MTPPKDTLDVELPQAAMDWPDDLRQRMLGSLQRAGVLVPVLQYAPRDLSLLLTQRSAALKHHAGQVSFPGGRMEAGDRDIVHTALRETYEEVGIPEHSIDVIGCLQPMPTITGYAVTPVIGLVDSGIDLVIDSAEVEAAFEVPLAFFGEAANRRIVRRDYWGGTAEMLEYEFDGHRIWGATAFIIERLINIIKKQ